MPSDVNSAPVTQAFIGLGANLGDPIQQIVDARCMLVNLSSSMGFACSSLYVSSPVGYSEQPNFINAVMRLETLASAHELLAAMQNIERSLGRVRHSHNQNAPRTIDLDLLVFGQQHIEDDQLIVPHPRIGERLFVLQPLFELLPSARLAELGIKQQKDFPEQVLHRLKC